VLKTLQNLKLLSFICSALLIQDTGTKQKKRTRGIFKIYTAYGPKHKWKYNEHILSQRHLKWNSSSCSEPAYINALQIKDFNYKFSTVFNRENNEQNIVIITVEKLYKSTKLCIIYSMTYPM